LQNGASQLGGVRGEGVNELRNRVCGVGDVRMRGSQRTGRAFGNVRKRDFDGRGNYANVVVSKHCALRVWFN